MYGDESIVHASYFPVNVQFRADEDDTVPQQWVPDIVLRR